MVGGLPLSTILIVLGVSIIVDGAGSIIVYRRQTLVEHLVRVYRIAVGVSVLTIAFLI